MAASALTLRMALGLLAGYGAAMLLWQLLSWLHRALEPEPEADPMRVLIYVRDQEQLIEGFLRTVAGQACAERPAQMVVVDTGSTDDTPVIVERLARGSNGMCFVRATASTPPALLGPGGVGIVVNLQGQVDVHAVLWRTRNLLDGRKPRRDSPIKTPQA